MNYRHIFHAGNFTEIIKHCAVTMIIDYLRQKDSAFCFIDTHAGEGIYDLTSAEAQKTGEAVAGVQKLINTIGPHPDCMQHYWQILQPLKSGDQLKYYPGSPTFAAAMLRPQDHMILNEYHLATYQHLKQNFNNNPQVAIHHRDAYEFLPAILPPSITRGLILIDPPFEREDENQRIETMLEKCLKRWPRGIYLIWYPITTLRSWNVQRAALQPGINQHLVAEFTIAAEDPRAKGLLGCQLLVINPPWKLQQNLSTLLKYLWGIFSIDGHGGWSVV
jgi:23S rRNA (adenine2030-N6)-methyltransferase